MLTSYTFYSPQAPGKPTTLLPIPSPLHGTFPVRLLSPHLYLLCMLRPTRDVCLSACIAEILTKLQRFLWNFEITGPPGEKLPHWAPISAARVLW